MHDEHFNDDMTAAARSRLLDRRGFVTAQRHQGRLAAQAKKLTNLCDGTVAITLFACFCVALMTLPWLLYAHDIFGDGGDYLTIPADIPHDGINWSKRVSSSGSGKSRRKTVTYYIDAIVTPHFESLPTHEAYEGGDQHATHSDENSKAARLRQPPGSSCAFFVPQLLCRLLEDVFDEVQPDSDEQVSLRLKFTDYSAGQAALAKIKAAQSVLQDRDTGRLFLLRDAPIEPYLIIAVVLTVASVILACSAGSQRTQLWNQVNAKPLPHPTRVWVEDVRRYMWQLHPQASQLLPKEYSGKAVQSLSALCVAVNTVLLLDSMRAYAACSAAADCAVPVADVVGRGFLGTLQLVAIAVPLIAFLLGAKAAAIGAAVSRPQLCFLRNFSLGHLHNVAWPAGMTRQVHIRQQVKRCAKGGAQLNITGGRIRLQRWRTYKSKSLTHSTDVDEVFDLPEFKNAAATRGSVLSTSVAVTVPEDAVLSSMPGTGLPFHTWYLVYELDIQGIGQDRLMVPLHVVPPLHGGL